MKYFLAFLLIITFHSASHAGIFNAQRTVLDNGMEVVVIPNHRAPIVHHMLWYKTGSAQELDGHSGVAHFLEHLLFKGTDHPERPLEAGEFSRRIKQLGGEDNAFTSKDYTAFYQTTSKQHLNTIMQMEADRIRHAMPPVEHVLSERDVVIEERNQRTENNPQARFYETLNAALFPNHPYGRPVIGLPDDIRKMDHKDTKAFYDHWYHPNNTVLVIAGDVTLDQIRPDIQRIYGTLPKGPEVSRDFPPVQPITQRVLITKEDSQVKQPLFLRATHAPSFHQNKQHSLALQLLEEIIDGGTTTRLYKTLVVEDKKAINVSFSYSSDQYDTSSIWITATPADGTPLEELESAVESLLKNIKENGVTEQEITDAKKRLTNAAIFARDSLSTPAHVIGRALTTGSELNDIEAWDTQISSVTKEQIQIVIDQYLNIEKTKPIIGYLLPEMKKATEKTTETESETTQ
ncbi:MAG: M16 family metallopeptidase [Bdellovibrionales bacterium]